MTSLQSAAARGISYRPRLHTRRIIIHETHTPRTGTANLEAFLAVKGRTMGLLEVGYHYLILCDGRVLSCRPHTAVGTHCRGYNRESIGVCLEGDGEEDIPPLQLRNTALTIGLLTEYYGPLPVVGHTELEGYREREARCPPDSTMEKIRAWANS